MSDVPADSAPQPATTLANKPVRLHAPPISQWIASRPAGLLGLVAVIIGLLLPPKGLGFSTCTLQNQTGYPCPGCGLTRSVSSILHGHFAWAWHYNPFGFGFALVFVGLAALVLMPMRVRERIAERMARFDMAIARIIVVFAIGLVVFGFWRAYLVATDDPSQSWWRASEGTLPPFVQQDPIEP